MKFYIAGADDARFYLIRRKDLNLMFTAGHHWRKKGFKKVNSPIEHNSLFLDSGAFQVFTGKSDHKRFPWKNEEYLDFVKKVDPNYYATLDYPCEPFMVERIGSDIKTNIDMTVKNTVDLYDLIDDGYMQESEAELIPVVQGWDVNDYVYCVDLMKEQGLIKDYMAIGTLCRRGITKDILNILKRLKRELPKTKFHGFGVKISMLKIPETYQYLISCDSAAWVSMVAFGEIPIYTGKKLIKIKYRDLNINSFERLSISVNSYVSYVEHLINKYQNQKPLSDYMTKEET